MPGKLGFGAQFWLHNGTALTKVADIISVNRPNISVDTIDVTTHDSAGGVREFIAGLADPGDLSVQMLYVPGSAGDTLLLAALSARAPKAFKIVIPAATGSQDITGTIIPTGYEVDDVPTDDRMTATFTGKVSGSTTQAASV